MIRKGSGLKKIEFQQAMKYLDNLPVKPNEVKTAVSVGNGQYCKPESANWMKRMVRELTALKIDLLVLHNDGSTEICECKDRARAGSVGQLLIYEYYLKQEGHLEIKKTIICRSINIDVQNYCFETGINIVIYSEV